MLFGFLKNPDFMSYRLHVNTTRFSCLIYNTEITLNYSIFIYMLLFKMLDHV